RDWYRGRQPERPAHAVADVASESVRGEPDGVWGSEVSGGVAAPLTPRRRPGIQLADICAGLIASVARASRDDEPIHRAWASLKAAILGNPVPAGFWQVSERSLRPLTRTFEKLTPPLDAAGWGW